jgi:hypothetical protein
VRLMNADQSSAARSQTQIPASAGGVIVRSSSADESIASH